MQTKKGIQFSVLVVTVLWCFGFDSQQLAASDSPSAIGRQMARQAIKSGEMWTTTDHSKHKALQKDFKSGDEITQACLSCHSEASSQFHKTIHWTWLAAEQEDGKKIGKAGDSVNNFCISTNYMNDQKCSSCHPGWDGKAAEVNCLKCHGQSDFNFAEGFEDYGYFAASEDPDEKEIAGDIQKDIQKAAQRVGLPGRKNCGGCHFTGGGGDGVKHGDLDTSMTMPNKKLDVHMGTDGQDFSCTRCHTTANHHIAGRIYTIPASTHRKSLVEDDQAAKITCESCHTSTPHKTEYKPNDHTDKVACQSCHIPTIARVNPTKMSWDWSKAGDLRDGKPYDIKDELGKESYMSIKGEMHWAKNVVPEYYWFNGSMNTLTVKDIIDPSSVVPVSMPVGDKDDPNSRIFPFKIHRGKQPYDKINKTLLGPLLSGPDGYWTTFDWDSALKKGMDYMNLPFSGQYDFVKSTYAFPSTHMVAPKDFVVDCIECHTKDHGRMASLAGFYMPGRDSFKILDFLGWASVLGALFGVTLHAFGRFFFKVNNGKEEHKTEEDKQ